MAIAERMRRHVEGGAAIKRMFEEGARLRAERGAERVFDLSIGNPNLPPPAAFKAALRDVVAADEADLHAYMPNAGLPAARAAIAARVAADHGLPVEGRHVVVSCGAAGALNVAFKALLEPGDEVLVSAPYFVEYGFIAENHGGALKTVPSLADFGLDVEALEAAMGPRTKIVLVNTPNNPTGRIYSAESLGRLAAAMARRSAALGRTIYLVSDDPYRRLAYGGAPVPSPLASYPHSIAVSSFSKELSLPGERIGYAAANPRAEDLDFLVEAMALANRILGFVNAPSLMQKAIAALAAADPEACVDVEVYRRKRDALAAGLRAAGYEFALPEGAFYLFPKAPGGKDGEFVDLLREEGILAVPGVAFGAPGYFRLAYCVEDRVIEGALPGFARAIAKASASRR